MRSGESIQQGNVLAKLGRIPMAQSTQPFDDVQDSSWIGPSRFFPAWIFSRHLEHHLRKCLTLGRESAGLPVGLCQVDRQQCLQIFGLNGTLSPGYQTKSLVGCHVRICFLRAGNVQLRSVRATQGSGAGRWPVRSLRLLCRGRPRGSPRSSRWWSPAHSAIITRWINTEKYPFGPCAEAR